MKTLKLRFAADIPAQEQVSSRQKQLRSLNKETSSDLFNLSFSDSDLKNITTKNCENLIGSISIPVGVAGPVPISSANFPSNKNQAAQILIPLATTEGALVASISRGAKVIRESGGAQVFSDLVGMTRAPVFTCHDGQQALEFVNWLGEHQSEIRELMEATSSHLQVLGWQTWVRGRQVWVRFECDTDQAMGMNMITIAVKQMWSRLKENFADDLLLQNVHMLAVSGNMCSDKKDSLVNRLLGRGHWVQAEVKIPLDQVEKLLHANPEKIIQTHVAKNLVGSNLAGSQSQNMQVANVAAAVFAATGQDLAHVIEATQASTTVEIVDDDLYVAVTAPSINVGVIGGGTWLPAQTQARQIIKADGTSVTAAQLAETVVVAMLAGEISGLAALASGELAPAHQQLARSN
jgi:hydroxymethylglutaryl-CoA reductase (NADPH)